jgi:hypothetical protein
LDIFAKEIISYKDMATYAIKINERTNSGRALMTYLKELGILVEKLNTKKKSSYLRSQEDIRDGRVESFSSSEDMFQSLGI